MSLNSPFTNKTTTFVDGESIVHDCQCQPLEERAVRNAAEIAFFDYFDPKAFRFYCTNFEYSSNPPLV